MRAPTAHRADVAGWRGEGCAESGHVELRVVAEHADGGVPVQSLGGQIAVGPGHDDLRAGKALGRREHGARVHDADPHADGHGEPAESDGELDRPDDDQSSRRPHVHRHGVGVIRRVGVEPSASEVRAARHEREGGGDRPSFSLGQQHEVGRGGAADRNGAHEHVDHPSAGEPHGEGVGIAVAEPLDARDPGIDDLEGALVDGTLDATARDAPEDLAVGRDDHARPDLAGCAAGHADDGREGERSAGSRPFGGDGQDVTHGPTVEGRRCRAVAAV